MESSIRGRYTVTVVNRFDLGRLYPCRHVGN